MSSYHFILAAYKRKYLQEAIESILNQTYSDFALTIVDDASPEDLDSVVESFDDPRITYIKHEYNTGGKDLIGHWNNCLAYSNADYVILASDDDTYRPNFLEEVDKLIKRYPAVKVVHARAEFVDGSGTIGAASPPLANILRASEYAYAYSHEWIISSLQNHVFRSDALMALGGFINFPLAWHSDDATVLALSGNGVAYSTDILFTFRNSGDNISSKKDSAETLARKLEARNMYYHWLLDKYVPMIDEISDHDVYDKFMTNSLQARLVQKLRHLTLTNIFSTDVSTAWAVRRTVYSGGYLSKGDFYRALARKVWKNYMFVFDVSRWPHFFGSIVKKIRK